PGVTSGLGIECRHNGKEVRPMTTREWRLKGLLLCLFVLSTIPTIAGSSAPQPQLPGPDARQLWNYITKDNPYKSWQNFPNLPGRFVSGNKTPHGDWVAIHLTAECDASTTNRSNPLRMKSGSITIKKNSSVIKSAPAPQPPLTSVPVTLTTLTIMYKVK